jgi:hypothetical protein
MFCCVLENASLSWEASWALVRLDSSRKSLTCVCDQFPVGHMLSVEIHFSPFFWKLLGLQSLGM